MSMSDRDGFIWYNNEMVNWRDANTHVLTHTLHYGMGVFEGVRAYETAQGPAIFRLQEHTKRLFNSAKIVGMALPYTPEQIASPHRGGKTKSTAIVLFSTHGILWLEKTGHRARQRRCERDSGGLGLGRLFG